LVSSSTRCEYTFQTLLLSTLTMYVCTSVIASLCTIVPLFVQELFGWNSVGAGLIFLCVAVPTAAGCVAGWLTDRYGARTVVITGFIATTPALFLLRLVNHSSMLQKILLCGLLAFGSTTLQFFLSPLGTEFSLVANEISEQTGSDLRATSFSITNCAIALGGALGPLAASSLMDAVGWNGATLFLALVCPLGIMPCVSRTCSS
jgi:MFS family permease